MRSIQIINQSTVVKPSDFDAAVIAINKQIAHDYGSRWSGTAQLVPVSTLNPAKESILVMDNTDQADALGYHSLTGNDVPIGFVFAKTDLQYGENWTATLSHETLEQMADGFCALAMQSLYKGKQTLFAFENCDPVENDEYTIDGVSVSNFVFPQWFVAGYKGQVDFLGNLKAPLTLDAGGYFSYATVIGKWQQAFGSKPKRHQLVGHKYSRRNKRVVKAQKK